MALDTSADWISYILLGGTLGGLGQIIRSAAGLKKVYDTSQTANETFSQNFEWSSFAVSLIIGFAAGAVAALSVTYPAAIDTKFLLTFVAAGYVGADFIEAFVKKHLPAGAPAAGAPAAGNPAKTGAAARAVTFGAAVAAAPMSVDEAVIAVVAGEKHIDADEVKLGVKLSDLNFSLVDRRELSSALNIFFQDSMHMVFDRLIHPSETGPDQTVSHVIQLVESKHPRPRG